MAFMQQKRYIEAATFMKKFWERYEDAEEIIKEIASAYYQAEKYHLALKFYQQHIDAFPYDDEAWSQIARVYTHLNMFEEGLEAYDFALSINPDQIKVVFEKGSLFLLQNKAIEALDCFKEYLKKEKNGRILQKIGESYLALNKYHDALSYFEQSQTFADTDTIDLYYAMSKAYLESGKTEKAYLFIEKAIHQDELNTRFWLLKGIILTKQMQFAKAEEAFQSGLKINDKEPELWLNYSELHFQQNNIKKSIDILESALIRLENNALLLFRLSAYLLMEKNSSEAERKFDKALQIDKECLQDFINFYPASLHLNFVKAAYYQFTNN
jgi:tetratricopeptide (TPR) repeat protein